MIPPSASVPVFHFMHRMVRQVFPMTSRFKICPNSLAIQPFWMGSTSPWPRAKVWPSSVPMAAASPLSCAADNYRTQRWAPFHVRPGHYNTPRTRQGGYGVPKTSTGAQSLCITNVVHGELAHHVNPRRYLQCLAPHCHREQAMLCLDRVKLPLARRKTKYLSGGESQRVAIARTCSVRTWSSPTNRLPV